MTGMKGILAQMVIGRLERFGIKMLENIGIDEAIMILRQQIEHITGKQLVLMKLNLRALELGLRHGA